MSESREIINATSGSAGQYTTYTTKHGRVVTRRKHNLGRGSDTEKVMTQRAKWANVVAGYRALDVDEDLHPSFQEKKRGRTDANEFMSINLKRQPVYLTEEQARQGACVLANWQLTGGRLEPSIEVKQQGHTFVSDLEVGEWNPATEPTVGQLSVYLLRHNYMRLQARDQISFWFAQQKKNPVTGKLYAGVQVCKVELIPGDPHLVSQLALSTGGAGFQVAQDGGRRYLAAVDMPEDTQVAWVQSRVITKDVVDVSSQALVGTNSKLADYTSAEAKAKAIHSYRKYLDKQYLRPQGNNDVEHPDYGTDAENGGSMPSQSTGGGSTGGTQPGGGSGTGTGSDPTNPGQGGNQQPEEGGSGQTPNPGGGNNGGGTTGGSGSEGDGPDAEGKVLVTVTGDITNNVEYIGSGRYTPGTEVQIWAKILPSAGSLVFDGWNDGNSQNPRTITVPNRNTTYTASFSLSAGR